MYLLMDPNSPTETVTFWDTTSFVFFLLKKNFKKMLNFYYIYIHTLFFFKYISSFYRNISNFKKMIVSVSCIRIFTAVLNIENRAIISLV